MTCFMSDLCGVSISGSKTVKKAIEDPVLAPFVEVQIRSKNGAIKAQATNSAQVLGDTAFAIGVGNKSSPAVVKSLQVGTEKGSGADIEILDQDGGQFKAIFDKISRLGSISDSMCWVRWGWISTQCGSVGSTSLSGVGDPTLQPAAGQVTDFWQFLILTITLDYSFGTVKYTLHCVDCLHSLATTKVTGVIGTEKEGVYYRDAVDQVLNARGLASKFVAFSDAKTETKFQFDTKDTGTANKDKGIKGVWRGGDRNVLECLQEWTRIHLAAVSSNARGIRIFLNPNTQTAARAATLVGLGAIGSAGAAASLNVGQNGTVVFLASMVPFCEPDSNAANFEVATYLVNSGGCSPVISFKPNISFFGTNTFTAGGTVGGASSAKTVANKGPVDCLADPSKSPHFYNQTSKLIQVGPSSQGVTISRDEKITRINKAQDIGTENAHKNLIANLPAGAITAELRVQGDPTYSNPLLYHTRLVKLIVINPFKIDTPCQWKSSNNPCNEILSSANWIIEGLSHDIRDGSYTTTLKLRLPAPGADRPLSTPPAQLS